MLRPAAAILFSALLATPQSPRAEVTIAAASNLTEVLKSIGPAFQASTGIHPVFIFASTAQLAQQIENGAPCDLIAAADTEHVDQLDRKGLLTPGSRAVYAYGILALWIPKGSGAAIDRIEDLTSPGVRVIAIARPELAPYGQAAVEALRHAGIQERVQAKIVYAASIAMATQYGTSGNADAVFTAASLVPPGERVIPIDEASHRPIAQALGIVAASKNQTAARRFADFLLAGPGRAMLAGHGYRVPPPVRR